MVSGNKAPEALAEDDWTMVARKAMDGKAKPPGSLGALEDWAVRLSALQKTLRPSLHAARLIVFAADHGITVNHPAVSAYERKLSAVVFKTLASGHGACTILCSANDCALNVVDVGLDADVSDLDSSSLPAHISVTHAKVGMGSRDITVGPAMSQDEVIAAEAVGRAAVDRAVEQQTGRGQPISGLALCIGEVGIGNTTIASAIVAAVTGEDPAKCCGRGSGLDTAGLNEKIAMVTKALQVNSSLISSGPSGILQAVGGLEIAGMVGAYLRAADLGVPVIVDGFISGSAALLALGRDPNVRRCLFWSHQSDERGASVLLAARGDHAHDPGLIHPHPPLSMGLRLGEGTGAVLALPILRSAAAVMREMDSFEDLLRNSPP